MWVKSADVLETDLGDELVLMHTTSSEMFSLNAAGRVVWQHLPAQTTHLVEALVDHFGIDHVTATHDLQALLQELSGLRLIQHEA